MQAVQIIDALKNKKGQHVQITWNRACQVKKSADVAISKKTAAWVRSGISYANLKDIKNAIEQGLREDVQSLPWGTWRPGFENLIIDHKGTEYVRLYPAVFENLKNETIWYLNGEISTYEACEPFLLASDKRKPNEERPDCFTVKAESILSIAGE
jgi:hypothetical protein